MLRPTPHIRYHITVILAAHRVQFVAQYKRWIRPVVFENVRKVYWPAEALFWVAISTNVKMEK